MANPSPPPIVFAFLALFASVAVASVALQSLIWVAIVLFLLFRFRDRQSPQWPRGLFAVATLLFLISFFGGALVGVNPAKSFLTVHKYLVILLVLFIGAMDLDRRRIRVLLLLLIGGASICALHGILSYWTGRQDRITSFSGDKMVFGGLLMTCLLLEFFLIKTKRQSPWIWAAAALTISALFLTQTRGAWLGLLAGFILLMWRFNRKWLFTGLLLVAVSYFFMPQHFQNRVKSIGHVWLGYDAQHHLTNADPGRIMIWVSGWRIIEDHPWGIGQGNLEDVYPAYKFAAFGEPTEPHLHNNFLQILAQNGWIGLGLYLFWIFAYYRSALKFRTTESWDSDLNWTLLCVFTAVLVWGLTEYTFAQQFSTLFFFLLGLQTIVWRGFDQPENGALLKK